VRHPGTLLFEVGVNSPDLLTPHMPGWLALGLAPGGPGSPVALSGAMLSIAAVVTVMIRPSRAGVAALAVWVAAVLAASLAAGSQVRQLSSGQLLTPWTGQLLLVAGAAALLACVGSLRPPDRGAAMADRPRRLAPVLAMALALGGATLVLVAAGIAAGPGATSVSPSEPLPAVAAAAGTGPQRSRSLVLAREGSGAIAYYITNGVTAALGDADVARTDPQQAALDVTVSRLVSGSGGAMGSVLPDRAVAYVVFSGPATDPVVAALDSTPGLRRLSGHSDDSLWLVIQAAPRAELSAPATQPTAGVVMVPVTTDPTSINVMAHPQMAVPRELRLAERSDPGWRVEIAGIRAELAAGQPFVRATVPTTGSLTASFHSLRGVLVALQLGLLTLAVLLALPKRRPLDQSRLDSDGGR
jgi:hypothetical protein